MGKITFTVIALLLSAAQWVAAETYRIEHPDGAIEYTDDGSRIGAQPIELKTLPTYTSPPIDYRSSYRPSVSAQHQNREVVRKKYSITITQPMADQGFSHSAGVTVAASVQPKLRQGDLMVIEVDGKERSRGKSLQATVTALYRGSHTTQAKVIDSRGSTVSESASVTFYIQQPSGAR